MSDRKSARGTRGRRRRVGGRQPPATRGSTSASSKSLFNLHHAKAMRPIFFASTFPFGLLSSGTTGVIASSTTSVLSPSISSFSEFSPLSGLYGEIKLVACTATFIQKAQTLNSATLHDVLYVGTRADASLGAPPAVPSGPQFVDNLQNPRMIGTYGVHPYVYNMYVPQDLDFSSISNDAPAPATPYSGSPGVIMYYASNLSTNSTNYFDVVLRCVWMLRARV
jgi:hypothetical protein